jgi:hypothetical protein
MITLSLLVILMSFVAIVVGSILKKIELSPFNKGALCICMIGIIGMLSSSMHGYYSEATEITVFLFAYLVVRQTITAYRRGYL